MVIRIQLYKVLSNPFVCELGMFRQQIWKKKIKIKSRVTHTLTV